MNYKLFGKSGLRVSEICLGTMTFGTEWGTGAEYDESKKIFDYYVEAGGNFLDTANRYTEGTSEKWLGEFIHHDRDRFVIASKYSLYDNPDDINTSGNHRKNMMRSVETSLKRLQTDYLDILWLHIWDNTTPVEEIMRGLDDLIRAGKVHYIGISDTPAWIVSKANTLAELSRWTAFVGLQVEYSLIQRTPERDLLPMAKHFEMAVTPWSPLGAGLLTGKYNEGMLEDARLSEASAKYQPKNIEIAKKVAEIAKELEVSAAQVALAWLMAQDKSIIPIVGARKLSQIQDSLQCTEVELSTNQLSQLDEVSTISLGFPHDFLAMERVQQLTLGNHGHKLM